jgi:hypothetical protein
VAIEKSNPPPVPSIQETSPKAKPPAKATVKPIEFDFDPEDLK